MMPGTEKAMRVERRFRGLRIMMEKPPGGHPPDRRQAKGAQAA